MLRVPVPAMEAGAFLTLRPRRSMECRQCGYALWNLTEPRCPECGSGFDLRHYRFRPGTVAFGCPCCGALHAGAGEQYVPSLSDEATCQACGEAMAVSAMSVVPLTSDAFATTAQAMPWDDRQRLGWWRAWWQTLVMVLGQPTELVRRTQADSSYGASYLFAFFSHLLVAVVHTLTCTALMAIPFAASFGTFSHASGSGFGSGSGGFGWVFALFFIAAIAGVMLANAALIPLLATALIAAPAHVALWLLEPNRDRRFLVTARNVNYALGPSIFMAVPLFGLYCGQMVYIWTLVAAILMLSVAHRAHGGKAALAVLWMPGVLVIGYIGLVALEIYGAFGP